MPSLTLVVIDEIDALGKAETQTELQASLKMALCRWFDSTASCAEIDSFYPG